MKVWLVMKLAHNDPRQRVYLLGAHSSREEAIKHQRQVEDPSLHSTHLIEMDVDKKQPPVLVGVADTETSSDCKKNLPHG